MIKIEHFGGMVECNSVEEARLVLEKRYGNGVNEFWISGENNYPYLGLLVNNELASLGYFSSNDGSIFSSVGTDTELDLGQMTVFYTNTPTEEIGVSNNMVIPIYMALMAVNEFLNTYELPVCIEWFELT